MLYSVYTFLVLVASIRAAPTRFTDYDSCMLLRRSADHIINTSHVAVGGLANISAVAAGNVTLTNAASFCRIEGKIPYGENNTLNFEIWLPDGETYNNRYLSVGMYSIHSCSNEELRRDDVIQAMADSLERLIIRQWP